MKKIILIFSPFIIVLIILLVIVINLSSFEDSINYIELDNLQRSELKYWESKSHLVDECEKYQVDIKFVLAQGELESHFGTKGLGAKTNSIWNIGAFDSLSYSEIHKKHIFINPNASIEKYLELLTTNYLYGNKTEIDLLNHFVDKNGKRYASSTSYEESLSYKYENIKNLTTIDSLQEVLRYWTVQSNREY